MNSCPTLVEAELLIGNRELGRILLLAMTTGQVPLTFIVTALLGLFGAVAVGLTELARRKVLHWWQRS